MPKYTAKTADKHVLYEDAVQCPEADIDLAIRIYKKYHGVGPRRLKEDFCGTALTAIEFARRHRDNRALAVDLDRQVLAWGRRHHLPKLGRRAAHVKLINANVLDVQRPQVDLVLALNFSYYIFKQRLELLRYFRSTRASLKKGGLFLLDAYGGSDAQVPQEEKRKQKGYGYIWDQHSFNPINNEVINYIHFVFPDGSRLKRAFKYDWRLWSLREITETLEQAGFRRADVYWEGWDEDGEEGNGIFRKTISAENSEGWVAYIAAEK